MVKKKLKLLKGEIKKWSKENFGKSKEYVEDLVSNINKLDMKEEIEGLSLDISCEREVMIKEFWKR